VWHAKQLRNGVQFDYTSPDGEEGYPGTLKARVTYTLTDANELIIDYRATADRATPVNLSNHTYFNLAGEGSNTVLNHELMIDSEEMLAIDKTSVPTGKIASVAGTPFDFRHPKPVGRDINQTNEQLANGSGYDHTFVLNPKKGAKKPVATLYEKTSGRKLQVFTDQPGLQLYTANFLDGSLNGKSGKPYLKRSSLCLETQHFPDSPNQPRFPNTILRPGEIYKTRTVYQFSVSGSI
jgi:aldose 1-epimerase